MADDIALTLLRILPLLSSGAWLGIGVWRLRKHRFLSPLEASLTVFAMILGTWIILDWTRFGVLPPFSDSVAIAVSLAGLGLLSLAPTLLLFVAKWLNIGHSRYDALLVVPPFAAFFGILWGGIARVDRAWYGVSIVVEPSRFALWAVAQLGYTLVAVWFLAGLLARRKGLEPKARRLFDWVAGSFVMLFVIGVSSALVLLLISPEGVPWFSTVLGIPAGMLLYAFLPLKSEDLSALLRSLSGVDRHVSGVYLFLRDGTPLAALASTRAYEIEPERMQAILAAVRGFVETSIPSTRGYSTTGMRFEQEGVLAVSGQYVVVAAVYQGPAYDAVRAELVRIVRDFEERHWRDLGTWEGASKVAEDAAEVLSELLGPGK